MEKIIRIIHLEDRRFDADLVKRELEKSDLNFELIWVSDKINFEKALAEFSPDIILSDHSLPSFKSNQALKMVRDSNLDIPFILITATLTDELAVDMLQFGVSDYIIKDRIHRLPASIKRAIAYYTSEKEKQKYHDEVSRNEKLFRAMIENNADMITLCHPEKGIFYASNSLIYTLGFSKEELFKYSNFNLIHPDDVELHKELLNDLLHNPGKSIQTKHRVLNKNGNYLWCEGTMTNLLDDPNIGAVVTNFRDISKRHHAEEVLLEKQRRLKEAQHIGKMGSWELDLNTGRGVWSKELYNIFGLNDILVHPSVELFISLIHPDDRDYLTILIKDAFSQKKELKFHFRFIRSVEIRYGYSETRFELNNELNAFRAYGIFQDITERHIAAQTVELQQKRLKEAQRIGRLGSWEVDISTMKQTWSDELYSIYGFDKGKVNPSTELFLSIVHPDDKDLAVRMVTRTFQDASFNLRLISPDQSILHVHVEFKFEYDNIGIPCRVFGIVKDITESKETEEKLALEIKTSKKHHAQLLSTQINPHFIFNALNSVQYYILLKEDTELALNFASEFSSLMRAVLKNSKSEFIPISEEVKFLEMYLNLEQKRMEKKFSYQILVDSDLQEETTYIPPMIIQPYLENSVIHGIANSPNETKISISFSRINNQLRCTIVDNGIGRQKASELKNATAPSKKHESMGMKITQTRIELLNDLYDGAFEINVIDHKMPNGESLGTEVQVNMPVVDDEAIEELIKI